MIRLLALSLFASAQDLPPPPPEPLRPPYYSCVIEREVPNGTVQAFRLIERSRRPYNDETLHTWVSNLSPGGIQLHATWSVEPPAETGWIDILYPMTDTEDVYRIQVRRDAPGDELGGSAMGKRAQARPRRQPSGPRIMGAVPRPARRRAGSEDRRALG